VYDDKLVLTFNNKQGAKTISIAEIEETFRSDFTAGVVPKGVGNSSFEISNLFSYRLSTRQSVYAY